MTRTRGALARVLSAWRALVVAASLLGTALLWVTVNDAGLGVGFLFVIPVLLAAAWGGSRAAVATGILAGILFGLAGWVVDDSDVLAGAIIRGAIYTGLGYLVGSLLEQRMELRGLLDAQSRELAELRAIQDALIPAELPARPSLELGSCYAPAQEGVAGDFFIVTEGPSGSTVVVIGDVVGKGLEAARRASFVRTALATFAPFTDDPVRLLHMANYSLIEKAGTSQTFVTAACATFDPRSARLVYASAGHPAPVLLDEGAPLAVEPGIPLGIEVDLGCAEHEARLDGGAGILLYTDGLTDARRESGAGAPRLGLERVLELVADQRGAAPQAVVDRLRFEVERMSDGELADDLCMVALRAAGAVRPARPR